MLSLINLLILFFILLIVYQIILACVGDNIIEGLENQQYKPYDTNNPNNALILGQQNAGNIAVLKQQLDQLNGLNNEVQDISGNVIALQEQVSQLVASQQSYANQMTGGTAPNITGAISPSTSTSSTT